MRALWRKSYRDFVGARWQVIGLTLLVAIAVGLQLGALRGKRMLADSLDDCVTRLHAADLDIRCSPTLPGVVDAAREIEGVSHAEERMLLKGLLRIDGRPSTPALARVLPAGERPQVFALEVIDGRWPDAGEEALLVDRSLQAVYDLKVGQKVALEILGSRRTLPVAGFTLSSEHALYPVHPDFRVPIPGTLAVVHVSAAAAKQFPHTHRVDSLLFRFAKDADPEALERQLLDQLNVAVTAIVRPNTDPAQRMGQNALEVYGIYMPTAVAVLVAIALALYLITLSRLIHMQRRQFGTLLAIGERRIPVALTALPIAVVPTLIGGMVGVMGHADVGRRIHDAHAKSLGWAPLVDTGIGPEVPQTILVALGLSVVGCLVPALLTVRQRPADLMRADAQRVFEGPSHRFGAFARAVANVVRLPMNVLLGLRTVLRRRWVSGVTAVALGANFAMVLSFLFLHLSHTVESEAAFERYGLTGVAYFREAQTEASIRERAQPDWQRIEPAISRLAWLEFADGPAFVRLGAVQADGWISRYPIAKGSPLASGDERTIHIDRFLADEHGLDVGDRIVVHPHYSTPDSMELEVAGIFGGVSLGFAIVPLETGRALFSLQGRATGMHVQTTKPREEVLDALQSMPDVESVVYLEDARKHIAATFSGARFIITLALLFAVMTAVVFLGILASLDTAERGHDLAVLRALGWRDRTILGLCVTEVTSRGVLALALALPTAPLLAAWMLDQIREASRYRMPLHDPAWIYLLVVGIALLLIPLGALPAARAAKALPTSRVIRLLGTE